MDKKWSVRVGLVVAMLLGTLGSIVPLGTARAVADTSTPVFVDWTSLLPTLVDDYDPNSANDCVAGRPRCVAITINEMTRRFDPLADSCDHNAVFAMAYLRTTQTYEWARNQTGFFQDTPWVNHEDAVFAKYYFRAYDHWAAGQRAAVPQAWLTALDAAANHEVSGSGNLLLGMNAHVNRDLPFVLASIGIAYPDGTTRKPDHDKVNEFLNAEIQQLVEEVAARFDSSASIPNTPYGAGYAALFQLLAGWREQAWRNAEALTAAPTPQDRAIVAQQIEDSAAAEAQAIVADNAYVPPLTSSAGRDSYCSVHHWDPPPMAYPWGMP